MKYIFTLILLSLFNLYVYSQPTNIEQKSISGTLSLKECDSILISNGHEDINPSLFNLKKEYESSDQYDGDAYIKIILTLSTRLIYEANYYSSKLVLSDAMNYYHERIPEANNSYIRQILLCWGRLQYHLRNFSAALDYLYQAQAMFEEANDYGENYLTLLTNMAMTFRENGDILSAKVYMDEAVNVFEKNNGSLFKNVNERSFIIHLDYGTICQEVGEFDKAERCFK